MQEADNAVNQAIKEMQQRYDFRATRASRIIWEKKPEFTIVGDSDTVEDRSGHVGDKARKKGVSLKSLEYGKVEDASGSLKRQTVKPPAGIPTEKAKEITCS